MTEVAEKQTLGFQTEVSKLLHLMVHSLYSNKEVFLRELISNASDAADKLRFASLSNDALLKDDPELKIRIEFNKESGTLSIIDNGIGMNRDEVIEHLGTIAKSGTAQFLDSLSGDQKKDTQLIGRFGVGFYSAFIVADNVEVLSRKAGDDPKLGVRWTSAGEGEFTVEPVVKETRGTTITLHLREDSKEFADDYRLRSIIRKYSDHISLPVEMVKNDFSSMDDDSDDAGSETDKASESDKQSEPEIKTPQYEVINKATALWTRSRSDVSDEEYKEFYKHISHDFEEPASWSHNRVEGKLEYTTLLFIPKRAPYDMYNRDSPKGLKLYVQRVFIMDEAENFLPLYLRFTKGVLDSNDLPLNVSREILQGSKNVESMKGAITKRVLEMLSTLAKHDKDTYKKFWKEFGQVLKEGPGEDFSNREKVAKLLRFATTHGAGDEQSESLEDYVARMKEGQNKIYYITAESYKAAASSPHLEVFRKKGIEVLLMTERIDEWMMSYLMEFDGKSFENVSKGELDLGSLVDSTEKEEREKLEKDFEDLVKRIKNALEDKVKDVRVTNRLTDSPACLVLGAHDMGAQLQQIMKAAGQFVPESKPIMEINPTHPILEKMKDEIQEDRFKDLALVVFDQASLAGGSQLDDPAAYVQRINKLLLEMSN